MKREQEKEAQKQERKEYRKKNKELYQIMYVFLGLFLCMFGYFVYFVSVDSKNIINNPYNARIKNMSKDILRGDIVARNGEKLATTQVNDDNSETRVYPYGSVFAHPIGYSTKGTTELEKFSNMYLLHSGVSIKEKLINQLWNKKNQGDTVVTTLDLGLQMFAYNLLGSQKGAIIAMEPDTGKILAMASTPSYDPNTLNQDWESIISDTSGNASLLNRASQGLYPPGSTFKILTILEYIREHPDTYKEISYTCTGTLQIGEYRLDCHEGHAHGTVDVKSSLALSCNGALATMGLDIDPEKFNDLLEEFGYNEELPIDIEYKKSQFDKTVTSEWDIMQYAIGQGKTLQTPIHNAMITASVANGGVMMKPYFIEKIINADGEVVETVTPKAYKTVMTPEESELLTEYMTAVVSEGSGSLAGSEYAVVAGKTGSAEYNSNKDKHAWFTGFVPAEDPEIVFTILIENGSSGGQVAAPMMKQLVDYYYEHVR